MDAQFPSTLIPNDDQTGVKKKIAIIGAGPAGLAALKAVLESPQYKAGLWETIVFESRSSLGGVWLPDAPDAHKPDVPPATPLYDMLTTNLPHPLMCYSDFLFPPETPLFPKAAAVLQYLEAYADKFSLRPHILFNTTVTSVEPNSSDPSGEFKWKIQTSTLSMDVDLVIVGNGHYSVPRYPTTPGLSTWLSESSKAQHAVFYRHPLPKHGDKVLVVGAGPSGRDISTELLSTGRTVIHSMTGTPSEDKLGGKLKLRGRVKEYGDPQTGTLTFEDGSEETGVDFCILATGYEYSFPFLDSSVLHYPTSSDGASTPYPPPPPPLPTRLYNTSFNVFPLAQHLLPLIPYHPSNGDNGSPTSYPPTSLAFLGLLTRVSPLPLVEIQSKAVLAAFAHPENIDLTKEAVEVMNRYYELLPTGTMNQDPDEALKVVMKNWHKFEPQDQYDYRDNLASFVDFISSPAPPSATSSPTLPTTTSTPTPKVPSYERYFYSLKDILRSTWVKLEKSGEAEEWVRGVGQGGLETSDSDERLKKAKEEWVELMHRVVRRGEEDMEREYRERQRGGNEKVETIDDVDVGGAKL
ncbi:flavin-containing monooxygenase/FMO family protein [Coprinopsis cinerea AmutBmut pab1-1]|nr:flavin-containing monooxygenase/FMO family protein [Coprinopsis cinerea AmutBmut pab1-1]